MTRQEFEEDWHASCCHHSCCSASGNYCSAEHSGLYRELCVQCLDRMPYSGLCTSRTDYLDLFNESMKGIRSSAQKDCAPSLRKSRAYRPRKATFAEL